MPKRKFKGKVVSDKMEKAVVVVVEHAFAHPTYKKRVKVTKHYKAHNEVGAKIGDEVMIEEVRPLSREKRWRVVGVEGRRVTEEPRKVKRSPEVTEAKKEEKRSKVRGK